MADTIDIKNGLVSFKYPFSVPEALKKISQLIEEPPITVRNQQVYNLATLCKSSKINKYSLIKPTFTLTPKLDSSNLPSYTLPTEAGYKSIGYGWSAPYESCDWYTENEVLKINASTIYDAFKDKYWKHEDPKLDGTDYAVLNHFDGYNHNAIPHKWFWIDRCEAGKTILATFDQGKATGSVVDVPSLFYDYIMGVAVFKTSASKPYVGTFESTLRVGNPSVNLEGSMPQREVVECGVAESNTTYAFVPYLRKEGEIIVYSGNISTEYTYTVEGMTTGRLLGAIGNLSFSKGGTGMVVVTLTVTNRNSSYKLKPMTVTINYTDAEHPENNGVASFSVPEIEPLGNISVMQEVRFTKYTTGRDQTLTFNATPGMKWILNITPEISGVFTVPMYTYNCETGTVGGQIQPIS